MDVLILNGSMRRGQNTDTLLEPVARALTEGGARVKTMLLSELEIAACRGCYACQRVPDRYGCAIEDDMQAVAGAIIGADCVLFATPIYTWYCTAPMKAALDRHYGLNKFYGGGELGSLWAGKRCGVVVTQGYDAAYGAGPFETGIRRLCEHSDLRYIGMLSGRDEDDRASFITDAAVAAARAYAAHILRQGEDEIQCVF